ncbi:MAG: Gfo/Idh/MocA family oxidoreductase [Phycisphaerae bacterium]|nr:Gfo/Idh/MocA family oxidoreductase [Phycisphaerae bacterium]
MSNRSTRRTFVKHTAVAGASLPLAMPLLARAEPKNNVLNVAFVGTGGRAGAHVGEMAKMKQNCVCYAEVDKSRWGGAAKRWPDAKGYTDWRQLFHKHEKEFDVMFVATPDHTHFAPSMTAASLGKHCYTEKPLTWSVKEALLLAEAYAKNTKIVTQMGNQGHAGQGWRIAYEYVKSGALGDITEFHTWTNRPVWPQGGDRPKGEDPVPDNLDWESWIGTAPMRPFKNKAYHSFVWRGIWDFGAGALGDMACHTTDGIHSIMEPDMPTSVEPIWMSGPVKDQFPAGTVIKWQYPSKGGKPPFTVHWYDGKGPKGGANMPETPEELAKDGRKLPRTGNLMVGTKGKMLIQGDYWNSPRLIPEAYAKEVGKPKQLLERSPGHHREFIMACKGEKPREFSRSNWSYAGPMTAKIQYGNIAAKVGKKLEISPDGTITNLPEANELLWREPRKNWGPLENIVV